MMPPDMVLDREWLLGVARQEREALGRGVQYTRPEAWGNESPWRGRPVGDVLAHLAASEVAAAAVYGDEPASEMDEYLKSAGPSEATVDGWIEWSLARRAENSIQSLALEWGRAADLLLVRASKTGEEEWREKEIPWLTGDLRAGYFIQYRVAQWWLHNYDIEMGSGRPMRREHPPTYVVNDFAIKLIPYALSLEGHSFPGMTVQVELEEVGAGVWHQSLESGAVPAPEKTPDVYIEGRGSWFARLAGHRVDGDHVLYEGLVNCGGDVRVGETILRTLRAFP